MRQIYSFTNLAGRRVAGHSNTGIGTTVSLDEDDPATIAAVEAGQLVPYGEWATGSEAPAEAADDDQAIAAAEAAAAEAEKKAKEAADALAATPSAPTRKKAASAAKSGGKGGSDA